MHDLEIQVERAEIPRIREELGLGGIAGAAFSTLIVVQLWVNYVTRAFAPDYVVREVRSVQGLCSSSTKAPAPFEWPPLLGLWHKHFTTPSLMAKNIKLHWAKFRRFERALDEVAEGAEFASPALINRFSARLVEGHQERSDAGKLTGHWIVYKPHGGVNYFLTLAAHGEDEATAARARAAMRLDFPQLGNFASSGASGQ